MLLNTCTHAVSDLVTTIYNIHRCIIYHLDTLRVGVRHQNVPLLSDGHALWVGELAPAPPPVSVSTYLHSNIYYLPVAYCQHEVLVQEVAGGAQGVVGVCTHGPGVARGGPPAPHPAAGRGIVELPRNLREVLQ